MNPSQFRKTVLLFLLSIAALSLFHACSELDEFERESTRNTMADTLLGMTESFDSTIDIIVDGRRKVKATAPRTVTRETESVNQTDMYGPPVHIAVFDTAGAVETRIRCNHATYISRELQFEFFGEVVVETGTDRVLRTEQLVWDESAGRFRARGFVIITTPQDSITGYGFAGDQDLMNYNLRTVTGQFAID